MAKKELLAVAKARIIVMCPNSGIQTDTFDNLPRVQAMNLCIGVQFNKIRHALGRIGVSK